MDATQFPWLTAIIALPLAASAAIPFFPADGKRLNWYALAVGVCNLGLMLFVFGQHFDIASSGYQLSETYAWVPQLHLNWSVGADGLAMPLIVLTGLVNTLAIAAAGDIKQKPRLFYFLLMALYSAQIGVFAARDLLLFFLMWELELIPVYLLISIWGGQKRQYAATKFILYTALASVFILVAAFGLAFYGDVITFDIAAISQKHFSLGFELAVYACLLIAFGVKLPIFPLHTWLPGAHGEASAPVSMILAGVLLKMGGYALIRMNVAMLPHAHIYFAPVLAVLGIVNIVYGALTAFGQDNMKRRLAYSSISHMGFVMLGIASLTELGLNGALLQMLSHGLIAAVLFFLTGVTYDRTHTLDMEKLGGLAQAMPKTFALFTAGAFASLALPGMSGFVGELSVFLGFANSEAYSSFFKALVILLAAIGLVLTPIYLLSMLRRVFYGAENAPIQVDPWMDLKFREMAIALCLLLPVIGIGLYPKLAMQTYDVKTTAIVAQVRDTYPVFAQNVPSGSLLAKTWSVPKLPTEASTLIGTIER
ncbi:MAG: NAD(P)H-quinone oxidoreductase subunit 4 [Cyanobacteria bacterium P01_D01_bin.123]